MPRIVWTPTPEAAAPWATAALPPFDPEDLARQRADAHLVLVADDETPLARASLWWNETPMVEGRRLGAIGHYAAVDEASARALLKAAWQRLGGLGCKLAVGPMDGNTWRRFCWMTERGEEPTFTWEPDQPDAWPGHWQGAGFRVLAAYFSALNDTLEIADPRVAGAAMRLEDAGVSLRRMNPLRLDEELRRIHPVMLRAFAGGHLFTPLTEREFVAQYAELRDRPQPEFLLQAEQDGEPVGYILAMPDYARGAVPDTLVIRAVAVVPERAYAGLGAWLVARVQSAALGLGYRRAIHALMPESSLAANLSARSARPFRRYALFSRAL
jgi:GNAT superfamily N-acetyltransferase